MIENLREILPECGGMNFTAVKVLWRAYAIPENRYAGEPDLAAIL